MDTALFSPQNAIVAAGYWKSEETLRQIAVEAFEANGGVRWFLLLRTPILSKSPHRTYRLYAIRNTEDLSSFSLGIGSGVIPSNTIEIIDAEDPYLTRRDCYTASHSEKVPEKLRAVCEELWVLGWKRK